MKKYLIVLAVAIVALVSCKPKVENKYTSIKFKNAEITLAVGESQKLQVLYEPTSLEAPKCEWSSSNAEVVSVDQNGNVKALASGESTITAKIDDLTAVCKVEVNSIYDMLVWSDFVVKYDDSDETTAIGEPYTVTGSNGTTYKVRLFEAMFVLYDKNITYTQGEGFSGAGFMSFFNAPIEVIAEGEYTGYYWTNTLVFKDLATDSAGVCPTGALTDAAEWHEYLYNETYTGDGSFKGASICYIDWDKEEIEEYDFLGFIKNGAIGSYADGTFYVMNITWLGGKFGLAIDENGEFIQPYAFAERNDKHYELLPEEEVSKKPYRTTISAEDFKKIETKVFSNTKVLMHK